MNQTRNLNLQNFLFLKVIRIILLIEPIRMSEGNERNLSLFFQLLGIIHE